MTIKEVYDQLIIPPNLQEHMMLVAHVGGFIIDNWNGDPINKKNVRRNWY